MKSIRAQLLAGLLFGTVLCTSAAAFLVYRMADHEADEQSDLRLRQVAWALPLWLGDEVKVPKEADSDDAVLVQVWNGPSKQIYVSEPSQALPRLPTQGYRTIAAQGERWRVYAEQRSNYFVQIAQPISTRQRVAAHMALRIVPPLLLLLPALAAIIWVVVGKATGPLERMAQAVRGRSPSALQPLEVRGLPLELLPIVTSLNGLLQQIDSAMSAQRNFVADAAHELRSPLTALKLQLQLAERSTDEAQRAASFRKLHERLERSIHLVQQLLTLARHEQTRSPPVSLSVDLVTMARQVVADHSIYAESKAIDLGMVVASHTLVVRAHAEGLQVMLNNLVDNALRYTQLGGQVDVLVGVESGKPYLKVVDNGPGVPELERGRIFDRFYRPDGNAVWGCGLGMSIVKNVVDSHGAEIELTNNPCGTGLVVMVRLPVAGLV